MVIIIMGKISAITEAMGFCAAALFFTLVMAGVVEAGEEKIQLEEFYDREYGYFFRYPVDWQIRPLPEGEVQRDVRVMLQGPNGSSFTVVVEKQAKKLTREEFEAGTDQRPYVDALISQTIQQVYKSISQNINAADMALGERRDLSNEVGIKFYVATLHKMKIGKPIIVAGIHAFPFAKEYSINFLMTTFWDKAETQEQKVLTAVFNSFQLVGERRNTEGSRNPDETGARPKVQ